MKAHLIDTHLLVPGSRSSAKVKVKYQGHVPQKMGVSGAFMFQKHILFFFVNCKCFPFGHASNFVVWYRLNTLPLLQILDSSKLKEFADDNFEICKKC